MKNLRSLRNSSLFVLFIILALAEIACSSPQGYRIEGRAMTELEGRTVYLKDAYTDKAQDSTKVVNGKFTFSNTTEVTEPEIKILSVRAHGFGFEYRLPVVLENGNIKASLATLVCTGGTPLNERMQDFLMAVDEYSTTCAKQPTEQIKKGFADLLRKYIGLNRDNVISRYISTSYRTALEE